MRSETTLYALAITASTLTLSSELMAQKRGLNVLMVVVDDLRPELGCYGVEDVKSPNIDRLATKGVVLKNAYCNIPISGASRASLLTGIYPKLPKRFNGAYARASVDAPDAVPLSGIFTQNGYHTVSNGKIFHNIDDHSASWSEEPWRVFVDGYGKDWAVYNKWKLWADPASANYINEKSKRGPYCEAADVDDDAYYDGRVAAKGVADLKRLSASDKPFFLACGFWRPHLPLNAPKKYWDLYDRDELKMADNRYRPEGAPKQVSGSSEVYSYSKVNLKDEAMLREFKHGYYASVSYIDEQIGKLLDTVEELGLYDNTVIIMLGDHGWHLGEHSFWGKHNLMRHSTHTPLIIAAPKTKRGATSSSVVEFVDIYPTLCDLCGIETPSDQLDGESMLPILKSPKKSIKRYAFAQYAKGRNIIDSQYSYSEWYNNDGSVSTKMLYDHHVDPAENHNVASQPEYAEVVTQLSRELALWYSGI